MLTAADVRRAVDLRALASELDDSFRSYDGSGDAARTRAVLGNVTAMVLMPGIAASIPAYTVKVHAKNPARTPAIGGVIALHQLTSGHLLAIIDSGWLTNVRTALSAVSATLRLARSNAAHVTLVGAGALGAAVLDQLLSARPFQAATICDLDADRVARLLRDLRRRHPDVHLTAAVSADEPTPNTDVIVTATWGTAPVLEADTIRPGVHLTTLGTDEPGKCEVASTSRCDVLVVDDQALANPVVGPATATLSDVLRGDHPGRSSSDQVTRYSPVGLPMQDCVAAWHVYRNGRALGLGHPINLTDTG